MNSAIGIFDSGVGGLTVVREIIKALPDENLIYFGDTARVPYGTKSKETITKYARQTVNFLMTKNVKALVIACGSVSSNSYEALAGEYSLPMFEMVGSGVSACLEATENGRVGIIGTEATVRSGSYDRLISERNSGASVFSKACPLFVPLAEEGWIDSKITKMAAENYLRELVDEGIDTLVLGCTHYPLLIGCISEVCGGGIKIVNPAAAAAGKLKNYLAENGMLNGKKKGAPPDYRFYVSDNTAKFGQICALVLGKVYAAEKIDIERY